MISFGGSKPRGIFSTFPDQRYSPINAYIPFLRILGKTELIIPPVCSIICYVIDATEEGGMR